MRQNLLRNTLLSLLLVLLVLTTTPLLIGHNVEALAIANTRALLPPALQSQIEISPGNFTRAWWRSTAQVNVKYTPLGSQPLVMRLDMDIQHGPILFTPEGMTLGLLYAAIDPQFDSAEIRTALQELPFSLPDMSVTMHVALNSALTASLRITPVSHANADGQFEFTGIEGLVIAHADQSAEFTLAMEKLTAEEYGSAFAFNMEGLTMQASSDQITNVLARSATSMTLASLNSISSNPFAITGLELEIRIHPASAESTDFYQRSAIREINSKFPVSSFSWISEINGIRNELILQYYALLLEIRGLMNSSGGIITADVTRSAEALLLLLLQNPIVLNNAIALHAYAGDHTFDLRIHWRGLPDTTEVARLDLNAAVSALDLTLDVTMDVEAIASSPWRDFVDTYVQQGYLQLDQGRIRIRAEIANNEMHVNGQRVALEDIL